MTYSKIVHRPELQTFRPISDRLDSETLRKLVVIAKGGSK
jgi:hypothetical protein